MKTLLRSLAFTLVTGLGTLVLAQNTVTITGTVTPCIGVVYPVHIVTNTVPPIDTTVYTGANCQYSFTFNPVETQGSFSISTSCDGGTTWSTATGSWIPFFPIVTMNLSCTAGPCFLESSINALNNQPWEVWFGAVAGNGMLPYAYTWEFSDGSTSNQSSYTWTLPSAGAYSACLLVTDANGCESDTCFYFDMDADGNMVVGGGNPACNPCVGITQPTDGPVGPPIPWSLQATNCSSGGVEPVNYFYQWSTGETTPQITAATVGEYLVCIYMLDANGCQATACDSVNVDENGIVIGWGGPANDDCGSPIQLTMESACAPVAGNLIGATESFSPINCEGFVSSNANDVWYSFVATGTSATIQAQGGGNSTDGLDLVLEVFEESCTIASIDCSDAETFGGQEEVVLTTIPGTVYFYRLYAFTGQIPSTYAFTTCVFGDQNGLLDCENVPGGTALPGTPCDDGDPLTLNDTWSPSCVCSGIAPPACNACFAFVSSQPWVVEITNCTNGGNAPYTYAWVFSDGQTSILPDPVWNLTIPGAYTACLTITDMNGCTSSTCDSLYVDANGIVDPITPCQSCFDVEQAMDNGSPLPFTAYFNANCIQGMPNYLAWFDYGDGTGAWALPTHTYNAAGTYAACLTITDAVGCTSTYCDSVEVDMDGNINPVTGCTAGFWVLQAYETDSLNGDVVPIPNLLWVWNLSSGGNSAANFELSTVAGSSMATMSFGCQPGLVGAQVSGPNIPAGTTIASTSCPNVILSNFATATGTATYTFTGNTGTYQFEWSWGDGTPNSTDPYPTHVYANGGPYELCLTMFDGACTDTYCDSVSVNQDGIYEGMVLEEEANYARSGFTIQVLNQMPTGIPEEPALDGLSLWPNPVNDAFNIGLRSSLSGNVLVSVIDLNGRAVIEQSARITAGENRINIPVDQLNSGMYLVRLSSGNNVMNIRFVKN